MGLKHIVVGSGPAGISCAVALLAAGREVLMVDGGAKLESAQHSKLIKLSEMPPSAWRGENVAWMREGIQAAVEGIPLKLAYGSNYPYQPMPGAPAVEGEGINTKYSLGKGGLSTVWGTSILPFAQADMHGWPISAEDLAPHYRSVLGFMPVSQAVDALEEVFPTYAPGDEMPTSAQALALLAKLDQNTVSLRRKGILFGRSRIAMNASGKGRKGPCVRCGLCMYGCPYELLYSSGYTVDELLANPKFEYAPGNVVQRVEETSTGVRVHTITTDGSAAVLEGARVFVGAGVLATTALMLRSLDTYDQAVTLYESHYFLLPMLRLASVPDFERGNLHTLAQLFIEVMDKSLSPNTIHLQTYTYNDLFEDPIAQKLGVAGKVFPWKAFLSRLYLFQGFFHSDESPVTEAKLQRTGDTDVLRLNATIKPETKVLLNRLIRKLTGLLGSTGLVPLSRCCGRVNLAGVSTPAAASP